MVRGTASSGRATLRSRVVLIATVGLALTVAVLTALTAWLLVARGEAALDEDLTRQLAALDADAAAAAPGSAGTAVLSAVAASSPSSNFVSVAVDPDGAIRAVSSGPEGLLEAISDDASSISTLPSTEVPADLTIADSSLHFVASTYPDGWRAVVLGSVDEVRDEAVNTASRVALAGLACMGLGAAVTSWALRRATRPLTELATATEHLGSDVTARVPVVQTAPCDVRALGDEINALLARIEAQQRQRNTFLATVSHEIRTPLAIARGHLEAMRAYGSTDHDEAEHTARAVSGEIDRATAMVSSLLALARSEEPGFVEPRPLLASEFAADLAIRLAGIDAAITVSPAPAEFVDIDSERLAQAVLNAVTNAVVHNNEAVRVRVGWQLTEREFTVLVDDDGAGFPDDVAPEVLMEPFTHGTVGTSGLGLAVVSAVTQAHGGTVSLGTSRWGGASVRIALPR